MSLLKAPGMFRRGRRLGLADQEFIKPEKGRQSSSRLSSASLLTILAVVSCMLLLLPDGSKWAAQETGAGDGAHPVLSVVAAPRTDHPSAPSYSRVMCKSIPGHPQSCRFSNVCYNAGHWIYYRLSTEDPMGPILVAKYGTSNVLLAHEASDADITLQPSKTTARTTERKPVEKFNIEQGIGGMPVSAEFHDGDFVLSSRSIHSENVGHVMFDVYFPVLMDLHHHMRDPFERNITLLSPGPGFGERGGPENVIDDHIGSAIFSDISYLAKPRGRFSSGVHCFANLFVGSTGFSGLNGGLRGNGDVVRRVRKNVLRRFGVGDVPASVDFKVPNIVFLKKVESAWGHNNVIANFDALVSQTERDFPDASVTVAVPSNMSMTDQVRLYASASIIVCQWGGISLLNFLAPVGATEIVVTAWFEKKGYMWTGSKERAILCPDWESLVRDNIPDIDTYTYCTNTNGWDPMVVDPRRLSALIGKASQIRKDSRSVSKFSCLDDGSACRLQNVCLSRTGAKYFLGGKDKGFPDKFEMLWNNDLRWTFGVPNQSRLHNFALTSVPDETGSDVQWITSPAVLALTRKASYHSVRAALGAVQHFGLHDTAQVEVFHNECHGLVCIDEAIRSQSFHWPGVHLSELPRREMCYRDVIVLQESFYKLVLPSTSHALERLTARGQIPLITFLDDEHGGVDFTELKLTAESRFVEGSARFVSVSGEMDSSIVLSTVRQSTVVVTHMLTVEAVASALSPGTALVIVVLNCRLSSDNVISLPRNVLEMRSFSTVIEPYCHSPDPRKIVHPRQRFGSVLASAFIAASESSVDAFMQSHNRIWLGSSHHKTGTVLLDKVFRILNRRGCNTKTVTWSELNWKNTEYCTDYLFWHGHFTSHDLASLSRSTNYAVVNTARDPFWIIVSAYLYHRRGEEEWTKMRRCTGDSCPEHFTNHTRHGRFLHITDVVPEASFETTLLAYGCPPDSYSYQDCLLRVDVSEGVWIEARRSIYEISHMYDLKVAGKTDANILNVCLEEFEAGFADTMKKLLHFLQVSPTPDLMERLMREDTYSVTKGPTTGQSHNHFTRDDPDRQLAYSSVTSSEVAQKTLNEGLLMRLRLISSEMECNVQR